MQACSLLPFSRGALEPRKEADGELGPQSTSCQPQHLRRNASPPADRPAQRMTFVFVMGCSGSTRKEKHFGENSSVNKRVEGGATFFFFFELFEKTVKTCRTGRAQV